MLAVMLLLLHASGAPVEDVPTDTPAGEPSGEEEVWPSDLLSASPVWLSVLDATRRHKKEFEDEFHNVLKYHFLENYKVSSLPVGCPHSNFSKEACLHRLAQGLLIYTALLKHVEKEYPGSLICSVVKYNSGLLINMSKDKMRNPEQVTALSSSQEAQLLRDLDSPDAFQRKMTAHSILRQLHHFLIDSKRAITKKEKTRGSMANRVLTPISLYDVTFKDEVINNQI
ncbi:interleukin-6-like [Anoplopoma fimbria]|uniref:interleukin-6-like n=1 Tax=Anoplopoma fimbria TaxID=229290 RepID=UPI0023ECF037|nr:interleukin-6-like [Anoplopoma fimbria]